MCRFPHATARLLAVTCLLMVLPIVGAAADDSEEAEPIRTPDGETIRVLTDEEAKALVKEIKALSRKREAAPLLAALTRPGPATHKSLHKPLLGLLKHPDVPVALAAAGLLQVQVVEKDRDREKLAKALWKTGWCNRTNDRRYGVRGRALRAYATLKGRVVSAGELRDVRKVWQRLIGDPQRRFAPGMVEICRYARESKDKRLCRLLAEEIDQPRATDINSPSNPPGEWWQRRYEMWREYNAEAVEALEVLTGRTFKTTKDAKAWFQANESRFGFRW